MLKASYGRAIAIGLLVAGTLAGCTGGAQKANLREELDDITKQMDDYKELPKIKEDLATCRESDKKLREDSTAEIQRLQKEHEDLKVQAAKKP